MPGDVIKQNFRKSSLLLVLKRIEDRAGLMRNKNLVCGDRTPCSISTRIVLKYKLQSVTKYLRLTLVFMDNRAPQEKFNCYFSGLFC